MKGASNVDYHDQFMRESLKSFLENGIANLYDNNTRYFKRLLERRRMRYEVIVIWDDYNQVNVYEFRRVE